jgi:hypothetical protein
MDVFVNVVEKHYKMCSCLVRFHTEPSAQAQAAAAPTLHSRSRRVLLGEAMRDRRIQIGGGRSNVRSRGRARARARASASVHARDRCAH